ncbi:hypothetical protein GCM10009535_36400 [Streptomyces thermocarboxydovorans]|uniref:Lipoprotein n=1 Tax=Streptomyces thermocarboxydovorans TaxID=59298 RepID=A0ABN1HJG8_9ACTN
MGRHTALPGALLVLLLATACSGVDQDEAAVPNARHTPSSGKSSSNDTEAEKPPKRPELTLPRGAKVLVPVTTGMGSADLPAFKPPTDVYTVYATCSGKGRMSIVDRDDAKGEPSKIGCNGPLTVGRVYTDITVQKLAVRIDGAGAKWKVAIVAGEQSM